MAKKDIRDLNKLHKKLMKELQKEPKDNPFRVLTGVELAKLSRYGTEVKCICGEIKCKEDA